MKQRKQPRDVQKKRDAKLVESFGQRWYESHGQGD